MLTAEFEPAQSDGWRRVPRAPMSLDARIGRGGLDRAICRITDLSAHGARMQTYSQLKRGSMIWLSLPLVGFVAASIAWSTDFEAGCAFVAPLEEHALAELVELGGIQVAA
jgi:hypothetical protein